MKKAPYFSGSVIADWLDNSKRNMRTMSMIYYVDSKGKKWVVPRWSLINGASIPRFLWWICSPFVGKYRRASVIHDYYHNTKERPSKETHWMFYDAMICDGVNIIKAKAMYYAIKTLGKDWD